jgi:hypothetical protein
MRDFLSKATHIFLTPALGFFLLICSSQVSAQGCNINYKAQVTGGPYVSAYVRVTENSSGTVATPVQVQGGSSHWILGQGSAYATVRCTCSTSSTGCTNGSSYDTRIDVPATLELLDNGTVLHQGRSLYYIFQAGPHAIQSRVTTSLAWGSRQIYSNTVKIVALNLNTSAVIDYFLED